MFSRHYQKPPTLLLITMMLCLALILTSCGATIQEQLSKLTPDERARVYLDGIQSQVGTMFETARDYVRKHPQHATVWAKEIVPAFSAANKSIALYIGMASGGVLTAEAALVKIEPIMDDLNKLLQRIGYVADNAGGK